MIKTAFIILTMVISFFPLNTFAGGCASSTQRSGGCGMNAQAAPDKGTCLEGDCENGKGIMTRIDGTRYEGQFKDGWPEGKGTFIYPKKELDKRGIYTFRSSGTYEGDVKKGLKEGEGTFTFLSGTKYIGHFEDDKMKGKGIITMSNGVIYEGEFDKDMPHSKGVITFPDGKKYVGEINYNHIYGMGEMTFPDGRKYVGRFERNKMNGEGVMTYPDGKKEEGFFSNDRFIGKEPLDEKVSKVQKDNLKVESNDDKAQKDNLKVDMDIKRNRSCAQRAGIGTPQRRDNYLKMTPEQFVEQMKKENRFIPLENLQKQLGTDAFPKKTSKETEN